MATQRPRVNVTMSEESLQELKRLAREAGMGLSEFMRDSVRVYSALREEVKKKKKRLYIGGGPDEIEKEVIFP